MALKNLSVFVIYKNGCDIVGVLLAKDSRDAELTADGKWPGWNNMEEISDDTLPETDRPHVIQLLTVSWKASGPLTGQGKELRSVKRG